MSGAAGGERRTIGDEEGARWSEVVKAAQEGEPVVWLESPRLDGGALAGRYLTFSGWAAAPGGLTSVEVSVAGHHRQAALGARTVDSERAPPGLASRCEGFAAYIDLGDVTPGRHQLVVRALGRRGSAQQSGPVHVDPSAVYRIWLNRRRRARERNQVGSLEERVALLRVVAVTGGEELAEALEKVARGTARGLVAVDPGASLLPEALTLLRHALCGNALADAAYGDGEVELLGGQVHPYPRQGWSAERLLAGDTVGPVLALGRHAARAVMESAATTGDIPSSVYGLALRLVDAPLKIVRVPEPLSRGERRLQTGGDDDHRAAVAAAHRRRPEATVRQTSEGLREIRWNLDAYPRVSIVIPSRYARGLLDRCLRSIAERTDYRPLEVVVADSSGVGATQRSLDHLGAIPGRSVAVEGPFNFSRAVNLGAHAAGGDFLLFLNDDTEVVEADWITRMVELAQLPGVGVVGAKLLYADGSVQHGGVSVAPGAVGAWHTCLGMPPHAPGLDGELLVPRDCGAVTGACMLVDRVLFERLGGFDEVFPLDLGDTDLCLRARAMGRRVIFSPHATLIHHESTTRGAGAELGAPQLFAARWGKRYAEGDPVEHPSSVPSQSFRVVDAAREIEEGKVPALVQIADSDLSTPLLECPDLPADGARCFVGNELRLRGWAVGATAPTTVSVELDGKAVPVLMGTDAHAGADARPDIAQAERAGFEVRVDTSDFERGEHEIRIVARDAAGGETSRTGTLDILPHQVAPTLRPRMVADAAAGRPVLACEQPTLDGSYEAGHRLAVHGWAFALSGIEAVLVSLDGRWRQPAEYGRRRPDLVGSVHPDAGNGGFDLFVDISDVEDGEHWLTVVALAQDGQAVGVEGPIHVRYRRRPQSRSLGPAGQPDIPERFVPEEFRGHLIDAEHQARYRWAARLAHDAEVLDAACGVGYGAAILAEAGSRRVVGVDRDAEAILNARARAGEVAELLLGDLRTLPFEENSFDLVTCFEAIEHVVEQDAVLDELRRVLRPEGTLLISSPNRETFTPGNPHHVHEYTPDELRAALGRRFANVRLHRQHAHLASFLAGDEAFAAEDGHMPVPAEVRKLSATPAELYTVAAASDAELPVLDDIVTLGGVFEVRQLLEYAWAWEDRAIAAQADAAANRAELKIARLARERAKQLAKESEQGRRRAQSELEALRTSKSWMLTAPLRRATEAVRRRHLR